MGVKCIHHKLRSVESKLVYFSQFWGMKHFLGPVCDIRPKNKTKQKKQKQNKKKHLYQSNAPCLLHFGHLTCKIYEGNNKFSSYIIT